MVSIYKRHFANGKDEPPAAVRPQIKALAGVTGRIQIVEFHIVSER